MIDGLLALAPVSDVMDLQGFADRLADALPRVDGRVGVLEDDLHLLREIPKLVLRGRRDVAPAEADGAVRRVDEPDHEASGRGLAAPRFPDEPERFALADVEADAVHRVDHAAPQREVLLQVADREDGIRHSRRPPFRARRRVFRPRTGGRKPCVRRRPYIRGAKGRTSAWPPGSGARSSSPARRRADRA